MYRKPGGTWGGGPVFVQPLHPWPHCGEGEHGEPLPHQQQLHRGNWYQTGILHKRASNVAVEITINHRKSL